MRALGPPSPAVLIPHQTEENSRQLDTRRYQYQAPERPGLTAALDYLRAGDTLVVWKLDRLGRSVKDVLTIAGDLHARGIGVRILTGKLSGSYSRPARAGSSSP